DKAQRCGLKPGDVRRLASTLVAGIVAGSLFQDQKVYSVVVIGTPDLQHSLTSVRELLLDTPDGGHVRLGDVADVSILPALDLVRHNSVSRNFDVTMSVRGRDRDAVVRDLKQRLKGISFPLEFHAEVLGGYEEQQSALGRLLSFGIAALIAIFLLLQAAFGSWRLAALTFFTLPLALVGGVLAMWSHGGGLTLGSLVGLFAVFG